jgi:hypothetical protein
MGIVLVQRASPHIDFNTIEMASWTPSHYWWSNLHDWLAEFVPSAYVHQEGDGTPSGCVDEVEEEEHEYGGRGNASCLGGIVTGSFV